jgi:hypothetical protein
VYGLPLPAKDIQEMYRKLDDTVPDPLLHNAIYARTEDDLRVLASSFIGDRQGMANTREHPSHEGEGTQMHRTISFPRTTSHAIPRSALNLTLDPSYMCRVGRGRTQGGGICKARDIHATQL